MTPLLLLLACARDLLPDEIVLPGELQVDELRGPEGFGSLIWADEQDTLIAGERAVWRLDGGSLVQEWTLSGELLGMGRWRGALVFGVAGLGVIDAASGELLLPLPDILAFGASPEGWAAASADELLTDSGAVYPLPGLRRLSVWGERILVLRCEGDCEVLEMPSGQVLAQTGPRARVYLDQELALWSDPDAADKAGRVWDASGLLLEGLPGDELGLSLSAGWAAGTLNPWVRPNRARVLPLFAASPIFAVDICPPASRVTLAQSGNRLLLGLPRVVGEPDVGGLVLLADLDRVDQKP